MAKKHVLVVEDDQNMAKMLKVIFEKEGFLVSTSFDGVEALKALGEEAFDAIILDILMPQKDGFAVLQERGKTKNAVTPVYVMTNLGQEENLSKAKEMGATECFVKSRSSPHQVARHIMEALETK